jgi:hypothetical protein
MTLLTPAQLGTLAVLANGIVPADELDAGAASVHAAPRLGEKISAGVNGALYLKGLDLAESVAAEKYNGATAELTAAQVHDLLTHLRDTLPAFFKQLRMDVSAFYLSDPDVWRRIGFPGPSSASGGYPDFARPQTTTYTQIAAGQHPVDASENKRRPE